MDFPLKASTGNCTPFRASNLGCIFRRACHPENASHPKSKIRDTLSAEDLSRKRHPILRRDSGTNFPPEPSNGKRIPEFAGERHVPSRQAYEAVLGHISRRQQRKKGARANADALVQGRDINQPRYRTRDQLLVVELVVVAAVLEVVLGDQLVVAREAVGGQHGQDPGRHDDAEVVV